MIAHEVLNLGSNPVVISSFIKRGKRERYVSPEAHTEDRPREHPVRRQSSASPKEGSY